MGVVGISHPCSFFWLEPSKERSHSTGQITAVMDDLGWRGTGEGVMWEVLAVEEESDGLLVDKIGRISQI